SSKPAIKKPSGKSTSFPRPAAEPMFAKSVTVPSPDLAPTPTPTATDRRATSRIVPEVIRAKDRKRDLLARSPKPPDDPGPSSA
ncbi:chloride channel protein, partial [Cutibacterium acnes]